MADNETKEAKPTPPVYDIVCERNGVTLTSADKEIVPFMRLKGKKANTFYPSIDITLANLPKVLEWLGANNHLNILRKYVKAAGQSIAAQCINAEGFFDAALYAKYLAQLTSTGLKISEIQDLIDELQATATRFIDEGELMIDGVLVQAFGINPETGKPGPSPELKKLNDDIRSYRQMKEDKQRAPAEEEEQVPSVAA